MDLNHHRDFLGTDGGTNDAALVGQEAQARVVFLLESLDEAFVSVDPEFRFTYVNRCAEEFWGKRREELQGRSLWDGFPTAVGTEASHPLYRALAERRSVSFKTPSVTGRWVECSAYPVEDGGLAVSFRDITERRRNLEALHAKSDEVTSILESVTDAFFALDREWRFTYVNREAERVLLRHRDELLGRRVWEEFPAAAGSEFETQFRHARQEQTTVSFQAYYPAPLDAWYEVYVYPSATGLSVYFSNINEERRRDAERERLLAEQQRLVAELERANARQQDSLHRSEERFRFLVEGVRDYAIFMLDPEGNISTWNAGAERFKGYKADEIIGQHFSRFYTPEDIARRHPWNELEIAAREGRYEEEGWRVRKDGSRFWANVVITALRDERCGLYGFGKVTRDITERRLREQERVTAQAIDQQRRFLKDVLASVTQGKLVLCDGAGELPTPPGSLGEPIPLSRHALKAVRSRASEAALLCGLPEERLQDLVTAASEGAMNAVQHAGGGSASVFAEAESGRAQVWIQDEGKGIDLAHLPRATLETGYGTGYGTGGGGIGHGFYLMLSMADCLYLLTGHQGTTIVLEKGRASQEPAWLRSGCDAA